MRRDPSIEHRPARPDGGSQGHLINRGAKTPLRHLSHEEWNRIPPDRFEHRHGHRRHQEHCRYIVQPETGKIKRSMDRYSSSDEAPEWLSSTHQAEMKAVMQQRRMVTTSRLPLLTRRQTAHITSNKPVFWSCIVHINL